MAQPFHLPPPPLSPEIEAMIQGAADRFDATLRKELGMFAMGMEAKLQKWKADYIVELTAMARAILNA